MTSELTSIYSLVPGKRFELCHPFERGAYVSIDGQLNGEVRAGEWRPVEFELITNDCGKELKQSDSPWYGPQAPIFRRHVLGALGEILLRFGELLPLKCDGADLVIYNPTRVLAALDEGASEVWRFPSGSIMGIRRHALKADVIAGHDIFKLTVPRVSQTFVSQRFVDAWRKAKFKGLEFERIWPLP